MQAVGDPISEANYFLKNVKGYVHEAILGLDWESAQNASWDNTNWCRQFVNEVHRQTGVWPIIYVQFSAVWQVANCADNCGLWGAGYPWYTNSWTVPPFLSSYNFAPWQALTGWQFTGNTEDRSLFYVDANGWQAIAKGDGSVTHTAQPAPQKNETKTSNVPSYAGTTWQDSLGVTWHAENGKFTANTDLHLRWGATPSSSVITVLHVGDVVDFGQQMVIDKLLNTRFQDQHFPKQKYQFYPD